MFQPDESTRQRDLETLARTYDLSALEQVLDDPRCSTCGEAAATRCSRCHVDWYCSRKCQVQAWPAHKALCAVIAEESKTQEAAGTASVPASAVGAEAGAEAGAGGKAGGLQGLGGRGAQQSQVLIEEIE